MDYFDLYKARCEFIGTSTSENRVINMKDNIERDFQNDATYRKAYINFDENNTIDCRYSEDEADLFKKYFLFKPSDSDRVINGMYITTKKGTFLISETNMSDIYKKAEAYICNVNLRVKGLPDMPCFADNTTYGVKGLKDIYYYKESDKKLKIKVQANNITLKYFEGQRFLFGSNSEFITDMDVKNEWVCYNITSKDFIVLDNQYVLELTKTALMPGKDDFINGIAWNEENSVLNSLEKEETNKEEVIEKSQTVEPNMDLKVTKLKGGESLEIKAEPNNAELKVIGTSVKLEKMKEGLYKITANVVKKPEVIKVLLMLNDKEVIKKGILIY